MKKIMILTTALLSSIALNLSAQTTDEITARVQGAKARTVVIDKKFTEVRTSPDGKSVTLTGQLVYKPDSYLSMSYDNGELFLIDGFQMTINRDGKSQSFDLTKNQMMKALSHALLYSFRGTLIDLSVEQKTMVNAIEKGGDYVITLKATKPAARGYSRIEVFYDASTSAIKAMTMDEFSGASTYYSM